MCELRFCAVRTWLVSDLNGVSFCGQHHECLRRPLEDRSTKRKKALHAGDGTHHRPIRPADGKSRSSDHRERGYQSREDVEAESYCREVVEEQRRPVPVHGRVTQHSAAQPDATQRDALTLCSTMRCDATQCNEMRRAN